MIFTLSGIGKKRAGDQERCRTEWLLEDFSANTVCLCVAVIVNLHAVFHALFVGVLLMPVRVVTNNDETSDADDDAADDFYAFRHEKKRGAEAPTPPSR